MSAPLLSPPPSSPRVQPAPSRAPLKAGELLIPGYRVCEHLNRGNVLDVYSVMSAERDCMCIAKLLRPERWRDGTARQQLITEGRLLTRLTHPHLVRGYELAEKARPGGPVLVLETLTGATLSRLIEEDFPQGLDTPDVALLGRQLCSVLHYLHTRNVLHLDLKPSNIICEAGQIRLFDLSLAQSPGECPAGRGTAEYMAPEQVAGESVGFAADVWGLGGVLFRAITGRRPFPRTTLPRRAGEGVNQEPLRRADLHAGMRGLVAGCLRQKPHDRPRLGDVRNILENIIEDTKNDSYKDMGSSSL